MSEKSQILDAILRLNRNIKRRAAARGGVNGKAQGKTLRLIAQNDGIRSSDLARLLDIRPPSLTQKLNKLEEDGNIKRMCDVHDARVIRLYITEAGKEILRRRDLEKERVTKDFSDCLTSEEKALFCEFCDRLSNNLDSRIVSNDQIVKSSANTKAMQYGKCAVCTADSRLLIPERIIGVRNCARYRAAESTYTMTAEEAAELALSIKPKLAVPTHYGSVAGDKDCGERFKRLVEEKSAQGTVLTEVSVRTEY